ncbi:glycoside hydrolase family 66 protein [Streptomyces achromogenes]|uniref:glycoside hydrolase family 66 protein n=1 Tax=Streptomyces achromogenes TaxID=67255 RepID=UPI00342765D5
MTGARHRRVRRTGLAAGLVLAASGLAFVPASPASAAGVSDAWTDASRYSPGQEATVTAQIDGSGPVTFTLTHLGDVVKSGTVQADGSGRAVWKVTPPSTDFQGYLVEIQAGSSRTQTAIDVSSTWTRFPRFGFLAYYGTNISADDAKGDIAELSQRYHINALQYYDWLWKHERPVKHDGSGVAGTWTAWNGDTLSSTTIRNYIDAEHSRGMAAMPYQMSYAALNDYDTSQVNPDWRLFNSPGGTDEWYYPMLPNQILHLMNPENPDWQNYIVGQYKDSVNSMGFDGAHLDQIGYWSEKYDKAGNKVNRPNGFAQLTNKTKQALPAGHNAVGFNAVDGYGDAELARSNADYLYTELWSNYETNSSVKDYLERQRQASGGKPHITPAYMNRPNTPDSSTPNNNSVFDTTSVQLANAMFAANGAGHLELGPNDHMLNTEYFLNKDKSMSAELKAWEKTYYDVITGYENLFYGPDLHTASNKTVVDGVNTSTDGSGNTVWTNAMRNGDTDVLHLINLLGNDGKWRDAGTATPPTKTNVSVKYYLRDGQQAPAALRVGSPDRDGGRSANLPFTTGSDSSGTYLKFTVPELKNWDFVYFDHTANTDDPGDGGGTDPGNGSGTGKQLVNANGKCAEAKDGANANGTPAQLATCTGTDRQKWTLNGTELRVLGKCLDVEGGYTANGTKTHLWDCGGYDSQKWAFQSNGTLKNLKSGRCLDIENQSTADGARLHLWDCGGWNSQKWSLTS